MKGKLKLIMAAGLTEEDIEDVGLLKITTRDGKELVSPGFFVDVDMDNLTSAEAHEIIDLLLESAKKSMTASNE